MTAPKRLKAREDWTDDEHLEHQRTGREPLSDDYRAWVARKAALHGIHADDLAPGVAPEPDLEDLDVEGHFQRIRRT